MSNIIYGYVDDGHLPLNPSCCNTSHCCSSDGTALKKVNEILKGSKPNLDSFKEVEDRLKKIEHKLSCGDHCHTEECAPSGCHDCCDYVCKREFYHELHNVKQGIPIYLSELEDSRETFKNFYERIKSEFEEEILQLKDKIFELEEKLKEVTKE